MQDPMQFLSADALKEKAKQKMKKLLIEFLISAFPFLLILLVVILAGAGAMQMFSAFGAMADAIFGKSDTKTLAEYDKELNALSIDDLIGLEESGTLDASFHKYLMFSRDEFLHLLKTVKAKNEEQVKRTLQIEARHTYQEWVADDSKDTESDSDGHYETRTEFVYKEYQVDSKEIENYQIDWQIPYAMCVADLANQSYGWFMEESETEESNLKHYGSDYQRIDEAIDAASMKYDYLYDLARGDQDSFTMDECKQMVHTSFLYGDPDTEEGEWEYYLPHSVIRSASSGYSTMFYTTTEPEEDGTIRLSHLEEASFMPLYDLQMRRFTHHYLFGYTCELLSLAPGGRRIAENLKMYRNYENELGLREDGTSKPGVILSDKELIGYELGEGMDLSEIPVSTKIVNSDRGMIDYDGTVFDEGLGGMIAMAAMEKVGCAYSQKHRWEEGIYDCSSLVWRVLMEVGIHLSDECTESSAAGICKGMVEAGKMIDPADIRQGDIIFYSYEKNGRYRNVSHTAIYAGDGMKVHARGVAYGVVYDRYSTTGMVCICRPYGT